MGCANTKASASAASVSRSGTEDAVGVVDANKPSQKPPKVVIDGENAANGSACQNGLSGEDGETNGVNGTAEDVTVQIPQIEETKDKEQPVETETKEQTETKEENKEEKQDDEGDNKTEKSDEEKPAGSADECKSTSQEEVTPEIVEVEEAPSTAAAEEEEKTEEPTEEKEATTEEEEEEGEEEKQSNKEETQEATKEEEAAKTEETVAEEPATNGTEEASEEH